MWTSCNFFYPFTLSVPVENKMKVQVQVHFQVCIMFLGALRLDMMGSIQNKWFKHVQDLHHSEWQLINLLLQRWGRRWNSWRGCVGRGEKHHSEPPLTENSLPSRKDNVWLTASSCKHIHRLLTLSSQGHTILGTVPSQWLTEDLVVGVLLSWEQSLANN